MLSTNAILAGARAVLNCPVYFMFHAAQTGEKRYAYFAYDFFEPVHYSDGEARYEVENIQFHFFTMTQSEVLEVKKTLHTYLVQNGLIVSRLLVDHEVDTGYYHVIAECENMVYIN